MWPHHFSQPLANSLESNPLSYLFFFVLSLSFSLTPKENKNSQEAEPRRSTEIRRMHAESRLSVLKQKFLKSSKQRKRFFLSQLSCPLTVPQYYLQLSHIPPPNSQERRWPAPTCCRSTGGKSISNGSHWITAPDEVLMLLFCDWPLP